MVTKNGTKLSKPPPPKRPPAPGDLAVLQSFINTLDMEGGSEGLATPQALAAWLSEHALGKQRVELSETDLRHAIEVREALRDLLGANDGEAVGKGAMETLSRAARSAQLVVVFEGKGSARLAPAASGVDAALGEIIAIAYRAMAEGTWQRLKLCRDDDCRWAYYDYSKNRSGSWCLMSVCGNRYKARKHREQGRP
jgi:predicted RNA-binding Zn ribbon-like protein